MPNGTPKGEPDGILVLSPLIYDDQRNCRITHNSIFAYPLLRSVSPIRPLTQRQRNRSRSIKKLNSDQWMRMALILLGQSAHRPLPTSGVAGAARRAGLLTSFNPSERQQSFLRFAVGAEAPKPALRRGAFYRAGVEFPPPPKNVNQKSEDFAGRWPPRLSPWPPPAVTGRQS